MSQITRSQKPDRSSDSSCGQIPCSAAAPATAPGVNPFHFASSEDSAAGSPDAMFFMSGQVSGSQTNVSLSVPFAKGQICSFDASTSVRRPAPARSSAAAAVKASRVVLFLAVR